MGQHFVVMSSPACLLASVYTVLRRLGSVVGGDDIPPCTPQMIWIGGFTE